MHNRLTILRYALLLTAALQMSTTVSAQDEQKQPRKVPTVRDVIERITKNEQLFFGDSNAVYFVVTRESSIDVTPTKKSGRLERVEWTCARNGTDQWCSQTLFLDPRLEGGVLVPSKPRIFLSKDGTYLDWQESNGWCFVDSDTPPLDISKGWHYFGEAGLNPYRIIITSIGKDYSSVMGDDSSGMKAIFRNPILPDFLTENETHYRVHDEPVVLDGVECWILEWEGMDKLWIDLERGKLLRRTYHWSPGGPKNCDFVQRDFREVKPGLWVPFEQIVDQYANVHVEDMSLWDQVACRTTNRLNKLEFDQPHDELFEVRLPINTMVHDSRRRLEYRVTSEAADPFSGPIATAKEHLDRQKSRYKWIIGANILVVAAVIVALYLRRKRRHATSLLLLLSLVSNNQANGQLVQPPGNVKNPAAMEMVDAAEMGNTNLTQASKWCWEASWREPKDCGRIALYILLRLEGKPTSMEDLKSTVPVDAEVGTSMAELQEAGNALGLATEVQFVKPRELRSLGFPYVLHGKTGLKSKTGHFLVVVDRNPKTGALAAIDPVWQSFEWYAEQAVLSSYSGYVLVPKRPRTVEFACLAVLTTMAALLWIGLKPRAVFSP